MKNDISKNDHLKTELQAMITLVNRDEKGESKRRPAAAKGRRRQVSCDGPVVMPGGIECCDG